MGEAICFGSRREHGGREGEERTRLGGVYWLWRKQKVEKKKKCQQVSGSYKDRVANGFVVLRSVFLLSFFDIDLKTLQDYYPRKDRVFLSRMLSLPVL